MSKTEIRHAEVTMQEVVRDFVDRFDLPDGKHLVRYEYVADSSSGKVWFKLYLGDSPRPAPPT